MTELSKAYFKELSSLEKGSKLAFVCSQNVELTIWEKGKKEKYRIYSDLFLRESFQVILKEKSSIEPKDYLYNFNINGVSFFGEGQIIIKDSKLILDCSDKLYKSERRKNYRLLTYPQHKSYFSFYVESDDIEQSNVVNLKTKTTTTGLFKNFLELVDDEDEKEVSSKMKLRVFDLSATGVAVLLGELEKNFLKVSDTLIDIEIQLGKDIINIPKCEVKYVVNLSEDKGHSYKCGIEFIENDTNLDSKLGSLINKFLRDGESEFEDFLN